MGKGRKGGLVLLSSTSGKVNEFNYDFKKWAGNYKFSDDM
jgi:hypothetical protein